MDSKTAAASTSADYQPMFEWVQDQENHILQVQLRPEFTKEDLRVEIDTMGSLRVSGEHKMDGQKPITFRKSFRLPGNSERNGIRARLQGGFLKVMIPFKYPKKEQPPASKENTPAAGVTTAANKQSEDSSRDAGNAKPPAGSGGEGGRPADKSGTPRDMGTADESRKQARDETEAGGNAAPPAGSCGEGGRPADKSETPRDMGTADERRKQAPDESQAGGNAAPPAGSGGEDGRPADKSVDRGILGTKYDGCSRSKYMNRLSVGLETRRQQIVLFGIGILVLAVVLGFYAAYRLGESAEDGN